MNDTFDIIAPILLIIAIYREWINRKRIKRLKLNQSANEFLLVDYESRIKFWRTRCEEFNLDKQILHERNLRIRFEKLYHKSLAELDKLKDGRKNNGTKHKQRETSKGNPIKTETDGTNRQTN